MIRLLVPSVWHASHLPPPRHGRCRRHADSDTNIPIGRSATGRNPEPAAGPVGTLFRIARALLWYAGFFKLVHPCSVAWFHPIFLVCFTSRLCCRRFRKPVAGPIFSPAPATPPHPCPALCRVPLLSPAILPSSFSPSCVGRPVRAGPVFGPAGPTAGRSPHVAGPACGGCDRRDLTRRRRRPPCVTRPTSRTVENALRTGVFGCACAYGRKRALPSTGPSAGGIVPTRRAGAPPAGPPTPTYPTYHPLLPLRPAGGLRVRSSPFLSLAPSLPRSLAPSLPPFLPPFLLASLPTYLRPVEQARSEPVCRSRWRASQRAAGRGACPNRGRGTWRRGRNADAAR